MSLGTSILNVAKDTSILHVAKRHCGRYTQIFFNRLGMTMSSVSFEIETQIVLLVYDTMLYYKKKYIKITLIEYKHLHFTHCH